MTSELWFPFLRTNIHVAQMVFDHLFDSAQQNPYLVSHLLLKVLANTLCRPGSSWDLEPIGSSISPVAFLSI